MKGKWKPYSRPINDKKMYIAGRQEDMSQPLHGGNVEYAGGCKYSEDKEAVATLCENLNKEGT